MTEQAIRERIRAFLGEYIRHQQVDDDQDIFAAGLVNSLFAMQLVMFIEKTFGIKVANEDLDLENFKSLNAMAQFVERKKGGAA